MTAKQWTLNAPAAIFFMKGYPFDHGHYTIVMTSPLSFYDSS